VKIYIDLQAWTQRRLQNPVWLGPRYGWLLHRLFSWHQAFASRSDQGRHLTYRGDNEEKNVSWCYTFSLIRHSTQTVCGVTKECDWIVQRSAPPVPILLQTSFLLVSHSERLDWLHERNLLSFWCRFLVICFPTDLLMHLNIGFCCKTWHLITSQVAGSSSLTMRGGSPLSFPELPSRMSFSRGCCSIYFWPSGVNTRGFVLKLYHLPYCI
jgi:hypothetical protein